QGNRSSTDRVKGISTESQEAETMTIRKLILLFTVCLCLLACITNLGQDRKGQLGDMELKLKPDRPSIFLTFERTGQRRAVGGVEMGEGFYLRLHNNLKVSIRFCAFGVSNGEQMALYSDTNEITVRYEVFRNSEDLSFGKSDI